MTHSSECNVSKQAAAKKAPKLSKEEATRLRQERDPNFGRKLPVEEAKPAKGKRKISDSGPASKRSRTDAAAAAEVRPRIQLLHMLSLLPYDMGNFRRKPSPKSMFASEFDQRCSLVQRRHGSCCMMTNT